MSALLYFIWLLKTFLTGVNAWRYCSESGYSPVCIVSSVYTGILFIAIFVPLQNSSMMAVIDKQENLRIAQLEEGIETVIHHKYKRT